MKTLFIRQVREEGDVMADRIHCVRKTLRLMPEEAKELAEKSKSVHMNEAEYIRFLIRQKPSDYPEIRKHFTIMQSCIQRRIRSR